MGVNERAKKVPFRKHTNEKRELNYEGSGIIANQQVPFDVL